MKKIAVTASGPTFRRASSVRSAAPLGSLPESMRTTCPCANVDDAEVHEAVFDDANVERGRSSIGDLGVAADYRVEDAAKTGGNDEDYASGDLQCAFKPGSHSEPHFLPSLSRTIVERSLTSRRVSPQASFETTDTDHLKAARTSLSRPLDRLAGIRCRPRGSRRRAGARRGCRRTSPRCLRPA